MRENRALQNQCLTPSIICQADVKNNANKDTKINFGLPERSFKQQFRNRNKDYNYEQCRKSIELSKYMWSLKEEQITSEIRWLIVEKQCGQTKINFRPLYLAEKVNLLEHFNDNQ